MGTKQVMRKFKEARGLRQFTLGKAKSGGRNSSGRITIFHRGGGSKRLQRIIDVKRTVSSVGIVERVEYDPNRSSWIAPVRWIEGVKMQQRNCNTADEFAPPRKLLDPTTINIRGRFWYSFLSQNVHQRKVASFSSGLMAADVNSRVSIFGLGSPIADTASSSKASGGGAKDVFFPSIAEVDGAKPSFFDRVDRIKPKAAVSWHGFFRREVNFGIVGGGENTKRKPRTDRSVPGKPKDGACKVPVTYIIASHKLEAGQMVVNYDGSKPPTSNLLMSGQNSSPHQDFIQREKNG